MTPPAEGPSTPPPLLPVGQSPRPSEKQTRLAGRQRRLQHPLLPSSGHALQSPPEETRCGFSPPRPASFCLCQDRTTLSPLASICLAGVMDARGQKLANSLSATRALSGRPPPVSLYTTATRAEPGAGTLTRGRPQTPPACTPTRGRGAHLPRLAAPSPPWRLAPLAPGSTAANCPPVAFLASDWAPALPIPSQGPQQPSFIYPRPLGSPQGSEPRSGWAHTRPHASPANAPGPHDCRVPLPRL